jgi:hypothetical protein
LRSTITLDLDTEAQVTVLMQVGHNKYHPPLIFTKIDSVCTCFCRPGFLLDYVEVTRGLPTVTMREMFVRYQPPMFCRQQSTTHLLMPQTAGTARRPLKYFARSSSPTASSYLKQYFPQTFPRCCAPTDTCRGWRSRGLRAIRCVYSTRKGRGCHEGI